MVAILVGGISIGTIFLLGCIGEIITEKSGHLNLGIPGIMCMGAAGSAVMIGAMLNAMPNLTLENATFVSYILLVLMGLLGAVLFGALGGFIYSFLTISLRANQNVTGLALTTFGAGFSQLIIETFVDKTRLPIASDIIRKGLPFASNLGAFGEIFLSHGILVYIAIALAIVMGITLKKSKHGLSLRAIGENPATADAAGINVNSYKYVAVVLGSAIAGIGGYFYLFGYTFVRGVWDNPDTLQAMGWLAIALVIFTMWRPSLSILGSILFGVLYILPNHLGITAASSKEIIKLLPYIVTVIVLIFTSIFGKKETQPPASLGINYFREER